MTYNSELRKMLTCVHHSVLNTILPWCPEWGVQTVKRITLWNWLWGLCHPLLLLHKSDTKDSLQQSLHWWLPSPVFVLTSIPSFWMTKSTALLPISLPRCVTNPPILPSPGRVILVTSVLHNGIGTLSLSMTGTSSHASSMHRLTARLTLNTFSSTSLSTEYLQNGNDCK